MSLVPSYINKLVPYQPGKPIEELERELGISGAIKLASNENPVGPSPRAIEAMRNAALQVHRYPDAATWNLRHRLATHHDIDASEIVLGNGSNEIIDLICRTYVAPNDHAVIGMPSFVVYPMALTAANIPFEAVPLRDHLFWDIDRMLEAVKPETRLLCLANPNNPTSTHVARADLERLLSNLPENVLAVVDEAYVEFADASDYCSALALRELHERLLVLRTFSKAYGLAGLRVGYAVGRPDVVGFLNRTRAPFNVGSIGQAAAIAALDDPAHLKGYINFSNAERTRVANALNDLGLPTPYSQTNFVFTNFGRPGKEVYEQLLRLGVIVRPMPSPVDTWLRISIGLEEENNRMLEAVQAVVKS